MRGHVGGVPPGQGRTGRGTGGRVQRTLWGFVTHVGEKWAGVWGEGLWSSSRRATHMAASGADGSAQGRQC